jgi:hypothetical protein
MTDSTITTAVQNPSALKKSNENFPTSPKSGAAKTLSGNSATPGTLAQIFWSPQM